MKINKPHLTGPVIKYFLACVGCVPVGLVAQPFVIGGDPRVDPSQFRLTTFATGLDFIYGMDRLGDGSLLVGTSKPNSGGSYFNSYGQLVRLVDLDQNGVADGPASVLYTGLPGAVTDVKVAGGFVFVSTSAGGQGRISVLRPGATPDTSLELVGAVNLAFPANPQHTTYGLATRPVAGQADSIDLFFNVGSHANAVASPLQSVEATGLLTATLNPDSIYKVSVQNTGSGAPVLSGHQQIASGLRNAAGLAVHPSTGDLYFQDNGIDGLVNSNEPLSADELNRIPAANIGGPVEDFGFASTYIEYRTGAKIGSGGQDPLVAFQPTGPDPFTGPESEGAAQIAFAPANFPEGLNQGIFIGFHGKFSAVGAANEENAVLYYDSVAGTYFHIIESGQASIGHLDGLLGTEDSLFLADMSGTRSLFGSSPNGTIYQLQAIPEPGAFTLALGLASVALLGGRRSRAGRTGR